MATNIDAGATRRLIDRQEIADLCVRYTTALDTKDWALLDIWRDGNRAVVAR
jgi:hypothetical protein